MRLRGVVSYYYGPASGLLVLQDSTGGVRVDLERPAHVSQGRLVDLEGVTGAGEVGPIIIRPRLTVLGPGVMPAAQPATRSELASGDMDYRWLELRGVVRSAQVEHDGTLRLDVVAPEGPFIARLAEYAGLEFASVVDANVRVRGVANALLSVRGELVRAELLVPRRADLVVEAPPPAAPFEGRPEPIARLAERVQREQSGRRVHVRGRVAAVDAGRGIVIGDGTGTARVRASGVVEARPGVEVDVVGFPVFEGTETVLDDARVELVRGSGTVRVGGSRSRSEPALTRAAQVRRLTTSEAARRAPVRLRAVVTYYDPGFAILFLQDASGGIYVDANGVKPFPMSVGHLVELEGVTDPGLFAPQIVEPRVRVLGRAPMPPDPRRTLSQLSTGRWDSQWVEVEGIVESVERREGHAWLMLADGAYRFRAHTADASDPRRLETLIDARVRLRGPCGTVFNHKRQLTGIQVFVPDLKYVSVLRPAPEDPFAAAVRPIGTLLQFSPREDLGHRVRVNGVVLLRTREGVFISDATGGAFAEVAGIESLQAGDHIDVVGFPVATGHAPVLQGAVIRGLAAGASPEPSLVAGVDTLTGNHDAQLVRLDAFFLDQTRTSGEIKLTLEAGSSLFTAHLPEGPAARRLAGLRAGSLVQLTGVCSMQASLSRPGLRPAFRMLLRGAEDVVVLEEGPWWTAARAAWAAGLLFLLLTAFAAWAALLKKRVQAQTAVIRRELERKAALEQRHQDLVENANDMVYVHDGAGRITSMNQAGLRLTGYSRDECLQADIAEMVVPERRAELHERIARALAGEALSAYELEILTKDGRRVTLEVNARAIREGDEGLGLQGIARDISERKRLEEQLRQSQKMEAVGKLAGGLAHDFNNLLGVVMGHGELLQRRLPRESPFQQHVREILKVVDTTTGLVRQLLAFSRKQVLRPQVLDLNAIVADTTSMLRRVIGEDVVLQTVLSPRLWKIEADSGQIQQVLMNLAINARDAMPDGGRLTIETSNVELDEESARRHMGLRPGRYVRFTVSDNGSGMDAATQQRIFEPFFTTKERGKGTGLGLATVYGIVTQSGGNLWVYSEPGRGTTFKIYLPESSRRAQPAADTAPVAGPAELPRGSGVVLVVEDEEALREIVREVLRSTGYTVLEAPQPQDALRLCREHEGPIDLVLTDLVMPGMSGRELVEQAARLRPGMKVVYMSGYSDAAIEDHGVLRDGAPFLEKPFTTHTLASTVRAVFDSPAA